MDFTIAESHSVGILPERLHKRSGNKTPHTGMLDLRRRITGHSSNIKYQLCALKFSQYLNLGLMEKVYLLLLVTWKQMGRDTDETESECIPESHVIPHHVVEQKKLYDLDCDSKLFKQQAKLFSRMQQ
ncbi:hypothetical protein TNCT_73861 [Trichonephila clavata]|uniref:Uncharacterized protein n=1 Tax=Trichonephila clavata TaxID=2740835 RepID=A0A8X6LVH3_TRICU|nr:hypothetical protein TNCT_73861 [Trichonephila clavata]